MKISMTVVIIATTVLCLVPYLLFILTGNTSSKKRDTLFKEFLAAEKLSLTLKEQWNDSLIGIDQVQKILIFIKVIDYKTTTLRIDLNQLVHCTINKNYKNIKINKDLEAVLQRVDLALTCKPSGEITVIPLYNNEDLFSENLEIKRAEKWQELILANSTSQIETQEAKKQFALI